MPGVFKLCASCLGYNALQQPREGDNRVSGDNPEEAVMLEKIGVGQTTTTTSKTTSGARMGILKMKREKDDLGDNEGEKDLLAACNKSDNDEEEEEGDSGACVDEFPVAAAAKVAEAQTPAESSAPRDASHDS